VADDDCDEEDATDGELTHDDAATERRTLLDDSNACFAGRKDLTEFHV
jgi:hypothetical protein